MLTDSSESKRCKLCCLGAESPDRISCLLKCIMAKSSFLAVDHCVSTTAVPQGWLYSKEWEHFSHIEILLIWTVPGFSVGNSYTRKGNLLLIDIHDKKTRWWLSLASSLLKRKTNFKLVLVKAKNVFFFKSNITLHCARLSFSRL